MDWYLRRYGDDGIVPTYQLASEELCDEDALSMDFWPQHEFSTVEKLTPSMENCGVIVRDSSIKQQNLWEQPDFLLQQLCQPWPNENTFDSFPQEVPHDIEKTHQVYLEDLSLGIQSFSDIWNDESMNWSTDIPRNSKKEETQFTEKEEYLQVPMLSTLDHGESSSEESALHDLQCVVKQLSKETRISFRNAMYRLAKSSMQNPEEKDKRLDDFAMDSAKGEDQNPWASQIVKSSDTQTSVIDTTVTSLLFSKIMVSDPHSLQ